MTPKVRDQISSRQRQNARRLQQRGSSGRHPMLSSRAARFEMASRATATSAGGVRLVHELANSVELPNAINTRLNLLKLHRPYHESDHILSMAYNLLAGGSCIEDLEQRRSDDAFLDMLGADRIPDPTTAGDFCRRFQSKEQIDLLQEAVNHSRLRVWGRQPSAFFDRAIVDADGTIVETSGECKEGMDLSYKGQWGYQHLVVSLANTQEVLFQDLRPGNRPSQEGASERLDQSAALLRKAGWWRQSKSDPPGTRKRCRDSSDLRRALGRRLKEIRGLAPSAACAHATASKVQRSSLRQALCELQILKIERP